MSPPEVLIWVRLRERVEGRTAFRRQHPIGPYIADFYCVAAKLVVEIDGAVHGEPRQAEHDAVRDRWMQAQGLMVPRVPAFEVMADPDGVVLGIVTVALEAIANRR